MDSPAGSSHHVDFDSAFSSFRWWKAGPFRILALAGGVMVRAEVVAEPNPGTLPVISSEAESGFQAGYALDRRGSGVAVSAENSLSGK